MKTKMNLWIAGALLIVGFAACDKVEETVPDNSIAGRYLGTLTTNELKSAAGLTAESTNATADVTITADNQIEVHCYSDEMDTTFMLNYYENHDSIMVCITGNAFEEMYGHMLGQGHMAGGMMGDIQNGETEWEHHMYDEHQEGDEHFGGFDTMNHTFGYRFQMIEGDNQYMLDFHGIKNR